MGTNYYLHRKVCEHCGRSDERLHIGKASCGWCFSLHVEPESEIHDLEDWKRLFNEPGAVIKDEYGDTLEASYLLKIITERGSNAKWESEPYGYPSWAAFHAQNHSEPGPNGILRHQVGSHCVKHGEGTWDCIRGEFS